METTETGNTVSVEVRADVADQPLTQRLLQRPRSRHKNGMGVEYKVKWIIFLRRLKSLPELNATSFA